MRVLLVLDEPTLARRLWRALGRASHAVDRASTYREATDLVVENEYALIAFDPFLGNGHGIRLLRHWRSEGVHTPVLALSARDRVSEKVETLDAGADDYLVAPFAMEEMLARARVLMMRRRGERLDVLTAGDLTLDRTYRQVRRGGVLIRLTAREFAILEYMMLHPNRAISRVRMAENVWDGSYEARSNVIDVLVGRLRRKLDAGGDGRLIETAKGTGYELRAPEKAVS